MGVDVGADAWMQCVAVGSDPSATGGVGMGVDVGANAMLQLAQTQVPQVTGFGTHPPMAIKSTTHIAVMEAWN